MKRLLSGFGADVFQALRIGYAKEYLTKFKTGDIVICDFKLADSNVVELIEWLDYKNIGCNVFVITDVEIVADAVFFISCRSKGLHQQTTYPRTAYTENQNFNR